MCLYLFPPRPKKHRYEASSYEDPRPRKKRVTHHQLQTHKRYEPLRGDPDEGPLVLRGAGKKRASTPTVLRGGGKKRSAMGEKPVVHAVSSAVESKKLHVPPRQMEQISSGLHFQPTPVMATTRRRSSTREATKRPRERQRAERNSMPSANELYAQYYGQHYGQQYGQQYDYSTNPSDYYQYTSTAPLYMPNSAPGNYYLDLCAVRSATNQALQATVYEPPKAPRNSQHRHLRHRRGYSRLR